MCFNLANVSYVSKTKLFYFLSVYGVLIISILRPIEKCNFSKLILCLSDIYLVKFNLIICVIIIKLEFLTWICFWDGSKIYVTFIHTPKKCDTQTHREYYVDSPPKIHIHNSIFFRVMEKTSIWQFVLIILSSRIDLNNENMCLLFIYTWLFLVLTNQPAMNTDKHITYNMCVR